MKKGSRILATIVSILLIVGCFSSSFYAFAADYPTVIPEFYEQDCKVGSNVEIVYDYYPAYNYEVLICRVYNSSGTQVAYCEKQFDNRYSSYCIEYTINWNTYNLPVGRYKVVMTKMFYSLYEWHYAPTQTVSYINLVQNPRISTPTVTASSNSQCIEIKWNSVSGAVKYNVYRRLGDNGSWVYVGTTSGTSFIDKAVYYNKYYTYSVRAYASNGKYSDYSKTKCATVKSLVRVPIVPKAAPVCVSGGIKVAWNSVPNAYKYVIIRRKATESKWETLATVSNKTLSYTDTAVYNNTYYVYYIRAVNAYGEYSAYESSKCSTCQYKSNTDIPNVPSINAKVEDKGITLTWNKTANATEYIVLRRLGTASNWTTVGTTTQNTIVDSDVQNGIYYVYYVRAVNSKGQFASYDRNKCKTVFFNSSTTIPPVPTIRANVTNNGISVSWDKVPNASQYVVLRRIGTESNWTTVGTTTQNTIVDTNVQNGIYYVYYIRAINSAGEYANYERTKCYTIKYVY